MGFLMASSCYLQTPISNRQLLFSSTSQSHFFNVTHAENKRRRNISCPMASPAYEYEEPNDDVFKRRKVVLLAGASILPFLQLRAKALEGSILRRGRPRKSKRNGQVERTSELSSEVASEESEVKKPEEKQIAESYTNKPEEKMEETLRNSPSNSALPLLNAIGVFGSGVLGALYALLQKEKKENAEMVESMKIKLQEEEAAILSMEKGFESKLQDEWDKRTKQINQAKEERLCLVNQLDSANYSITGLGHELKNEKKLIEKLRSEIDSLQSNLLKAGEEKRSLEAELEEKNDSVDTLQGKINLLHSVLSDREIHIQMLNSSLVEKESELKNRRTEYYSLDKQGLAIADSEVEWLSGEVQRNESDNGYLSSVIDELKARISSLIVERDNTKQELDTLHKDYDDFKLIFENKAAADAKLLGEREKELHMLQEKLELVMNDPSGNKAIIAAMNNERKGLERTLEVEKQNVNKLKEELQLNEETLSKSRSEFFDLLKQLEQSRNQCEELKSELSWVTAEFFEANKELQDSLNEAEQKGDVLARELTTTKDLLKKYTKELQAFTDELTAVGEKNHSLQKELIDTYRKAETAAIDLNEEQKNVSALNKELQALEKQIAKDKEARKSLEADLEEATKSLDEINQNVFKLFKDLDSEKAKTAHLEDENMVLYKALKEQKDESEKAREHMENAHKLVKSLGKERENLENQVKKLEDGLASAKGEILRLRSQINSPKVGVNDHSDNSAEREPKVTVRAKRSTRRRKSSNSE